MTFGTILREKRLEHGWTKEYIAERTNLMTRVIDALENEDFKRLQPPPYTRGHIRLCCDLLGIDPQPVIDAYSAALKAPPSARSVTRPSVHDLPRRPPEPIHTGAHRTFPPKKDENPDRPAGETPHRLVESAEASFTAVPKPVDAPRPAPVPAPEPEPVPVPAPEPAPVPAPEPEPAPASAPEEIPFTLESDPAPASAGRSALAELGELAAPQRRREVQSTFDEVPRTASLTSPGRSIFGPQRPVPDPPNPQLDTLCSGASRITRGLQALVTGLTRPKVRRMTDGAEPILNRRVLQRAALFFAVLVTLTLLVFAFRYVFKMSAAAEPEVYTSPTAEAFELRPVALPPPPYFKN